jgi:medium-chain acyl-[acyl-carrier-protein] hydrolase
MHTQLYTPVWREKFQVRSSDIGYHGIMRVSNLCSYFQEVAGRHAEHLKVGYTHMQSMGMAWVLSKLAIEIKRFPAWGEDFYLETWPLGNERIFYRRDYRLDDGKEIMVSASSYWIPLDLHNRRPKLIAIDEAVLRANQGRFGLNRSFESIPAVNANNMSEPVTARYSDLDQNRHVNNARYVEWIFDYLWPDIPGNGMPRLFEIEYKQEVKPGDIVHFNKSTPENMTNTYLVDGTIEGTSQTCLRSRITF